MKKYLIVVSILTLILCSCSKKSVNDPSEISVNGKIIKYSETKDTVEKKLGDEGVVTELFLLNDGYEYQNAVQILYNDIENIRYLRVMDAKVDTYKNISVGDDISKVFEEFDYVQESGFYYSVIFNGIEEVDNRTVGIQDDWIMISYKTVEDSDTIVMINIIDMRFATQLR